MYKRNQSFLSVVLVSLFFSTGVLAQDVMLYGVGNRGISASMADHSVGAIYINKSNALFGLGIDIAHSTPDPSDEDYAQHHNVYGLFGELYA